MLDFNETCVFSTHFREILIHHSFSNSSQWEPSCSMRRGGRIDRKTNLHTDGQTTKLRVAFRNFTKEITMGKERPGNREVNKEKKIEVE
jgi:hypothetical protein